MGVGVQAVAVVVGGDQRLQCGADVVEVDLLRMQASARRLDVILELLGPLVGAVLEAHGNRPDAPRDPPHHGVFRVHAVGEEEAEVGREVVDLHAARPVALDVSEAVGQGEGELGDRVRPRLGDVVARDRNRVKVAHPVFDEPSLDVAHELEREIGRENAGVLSLVLLEDVGLHCSAHHLQSVCAHFRRLLGARFAPLAGAKGVELLVYRGVEEHRQDDRCRPVDCH